LYRCIEDNLFRVFGGEKIQNLMSAFSVEDMPIESGMLTQSLDSAQKKVETYFYDIRKQLFGGGCTRLNSVDP
jgi:preprotein translocase subunit SecA